MSHKEDPFNFPWEDVEACRHHKHPPKDVEEEIDDNPREIITLCPTCGSQSERFFFMSPEITWKNLCGQAGWMEACFKCKKVVSFELSIMN